MATETMTTVHGSAAASRSSGTKSVLSMPMMTAPMRPGTSPTSARVRRCACPGANHMNATVKQAMVPMTRAAIATFVTVAMIRMRGVT